MLRLKIFVYVMGVYFLITAPVTCALLRFPPLQDSDSAFKKDVFERLTAIHSSHVCIWSHPSEFEESVNDLSMSLSSSLKSVSIFELTENDLFREECLHNVVFLQSFTVCMDIWNKRYRPITALHFVYVVVDAHIAQPWELGMENTSCLSDKFGSARVVLVFLKQEGRAFSLSPPQFPPRRFLEAQLSDLLLPVKLVLHNLNGREVKIATFNCTPYVHIHHEYDSVSLDGVEGRILNELSTLLNFKINIVEMSEKRYGIRTNESWEWDDGIMGALKNYTVDIGLCNIWCDISNIPVLDFAPYNNLVSYTFIVPRPKLLERGWKSLTGILHLNVWLATICCYLLCSFCYWLHCSLFTPKYNVDLVESFLTLFGMLTMTSWHVRDAARQLIWWWLVFVLLFTAIYSSGIAARLTKPSYDPRIDTIQQLVDYEFHWYSDNVSNDLKKFVLNKANPTQLEWIKRYENLSDDITTSSVRSGSYALLAQRLGSMIILTVHGLDYDHDLKGMRVLKERTIDNIYTCFGLPKQSALSYTLQNALLQLRQMGVVDHWTRDAVKRLTPSYIKELQQEKDETALGGLTPLSMHNIAPALYILLTGLSLSTVLFLLEVLYTKYARRNRSSSVQPLTPFVK